jgi:hypothetical protein
MMGGRYVAGAGQLLLAIAGFVLVIGWFAMKMIELYDQIGGNSQPKSYAWLGEWGAIIFAVAWLWSWVTSISILIEAKKRTPPKIRRRELTMVPAHKNFLRKSERKACHV